MTETSPKVAPSLLDDVVIGPVRPAFNLGMDEWLDAQCWDQSLLDTKQNSPTPLLLQNSPTQLLLQNSSTLAPLLLNSPTPQPNHQRRDAPASSPNQKRAASRCWVKWNWMTCLSLHPEEHRIIYKMGLGDNFTLWLKNRNSIKQFRTVPRVSAGRYEFNSAKQVAFYIIILQRQEKSMETHNLHHHFTYYSLDCSGIWEALNPTRLLISLPKMTLHSKGSITHGLRLQKPSCRLCPVTFYRSVH